MLTTPHAALTLLLAIACWTDIRRRKIPNALTFSALGAGAAWLVLGAFSAPTFNLTPVALGFAGSAVGFLSFLPLYATRGCSAGDVKLMMACGMYLGPRATLMAALFTFAAGGLMGLACLLHGPVRRNTLRNLSGLLRRTPGSQAGDKALTRVSAARLPYAVAIAMGVTAASVWQ